MTLRIITVHSLSGGAGCSTIAMLLADFFAQDLPSLLVEADPQKASLVDGFGLLAPAVTTVDLASPVSEWHDLPSTRALLDGFDGSDYLLPDLADLDENEDPDNIDPRSIAWAVGPGNVGCDRVFVIPAYTSVRNIFSVEDAAIWIETLVIALLQRLDEGGFHTVVIDAGVGLFRHPVSQILEKIGDPRVAHTKVAVITPKRADLRSMNRLLQGSGHGDTALVLNQCDSDLSVLLAAVRRAAEGDLMGTVIEPKWSALGEALKDRGIVVPTHPNLRWPYGAPFRADGFSEIGRLAQYIVRAEVRQGFGELDK